LAKKLLSNGPNHLGEVARMRAKKRTQGVTEVRADEQKQPRPVGMQEMGPTLYEQIRRVLTEMKLVSEN
jgi:hypothetical protein